MRIKNAWFNEMNSLLSLDKKDNELVDTDSEPEEGENCKKCREKRKER